MNLKPASQKGFLNVLILIVVFALLIFAIFYILILKKDSQTTQITSITKPTQTDELIVVQGTEIDTSTWKTFPEEGSYTGWTIKYPEIAKPQYIQNDIRVYISSEKLEEAVLITIENGKYSTEKIPDIVSMLKENDMCTPENETVMLTLNGYNSYKYTSSCEQETKTTLVLLNPYSDHNYVLVTIHTNVKAEKEQIDLAQKMLDTLTILQSEEIVDDGLNTFYDVNLGFSIKYPENFRQENDPAWKNADLLLYSGGQSYDLVVQVWNSEQDYKKFYGENSSVLENMTIKQVKGKIVTFLNQNNTNEVSEIINSFTLED